jgi:hypothetical protein
VGLLRFRTEEHLGKQLGLVLGSRLEKRERAERRAHGERGGSGTDEERLLPKLLAPEKIVE